MTTVDLSRIITRADKEQTARRDRENVIKAACSARIDEVANQSARENILALALLEGLSEKDKSAHKQLRRWISDMQKECRRAINQGDEPEWPTPAKAVFSLADKN